MLGGPGWAYIMVRYAFMKHDKDIMADTIQLRSQM